MRKLCQRGLPFAIIAASHYGQPDVVMPVVVFIMRGVLLRKV